jgi:hypothetical protein
VATCLSHALQMVLLALLSVSLISLLLFLLLTKSVGVALISLAQIVVMLFISEWTSLAFNLFLLCVRPSYYKH